MNRVEHTQHAIAELQSKKIEIVAGANADTDIAISGIKVGDSLGAVIENAAGTLTDRTATTSITSDGNIQCSVSTTGDQLMVEWYSKGAL